MSKLLPVILVQFYVYSTTIELLSADQAMQQCGKKKIKAAKKIKKNCIKVSKKNFFSTSVAFCFKRMGRTVGRNVKFFNTSLRSSFTFTFPKRNDGYLFQSMFFVET